jgi:flagellum-specific peptidoglycan hydrolase FlgJ
MKELQDFLENLQQDCFLAVTGEKIDEEEMMVSFAILGSEEQFIALIKGLMKSSSSVRNALRIALLETDWGNADLDSQINNLLN